MPDITIIMPVFNAASYLQECIDSILSQTERDWELFAIDDHSKDNSLQILLDYQSKDERIHIFNNKEKGIIPALRLAFSHANGIFITRMDADDKMAPTRLSQMKHQLLKHGKGYIATGLVRYFSENTLGEGYQRYEKWLNDLTRQGTNFDEIYKECVIPSPCWMLYKEDLHAVGAFQPNTYPEDYDLCFRFYKQGLKVIPEHKILHHWRDYAIRSSRTDPHYADNAFLDLKVDYFLQLDWDNTKQLVLWGAGKKGKRIAKILHEKGISFRWICNQPRKWGHLLHGSMFEDSRLLPDIPTPQIIIAVANPDEQLLITEQLRHLKLRKGVSYFFFC